MTAPAQSSVARFPLWWPTSNVSARLRSMPFMIVCLLFALFVETLYIRIPFGLLFLWQLWFLVLRHASVELSEEGIHIRHLTRGFVKYEDVATVETTESSSNEHVFIRLSLRRRRWMVWLGPIPIVSPHRVILMPFEVSVSVQFLAELSRRMRA